MKERTVDYSTVRGDDGKTNDVITVASDASDDVVVYFGGDVQARHETMTQLRDNCRYTEWSLENTAQILTKVQFIFTRPKSL